MKLQPPSFVLSALFFAIAFATHLTAQSTTSGGLTGVVTDSTDAVVPGAEIEIDNQSKGTTQRTKTDREESWCSADCTRENWM